MAVLADLMVFAAVKLCMQTVALTMPLVRLLFFLKKEQGVQTGVDWNLRWRPHLISFCLHFFIPFFWHQHG